MFAFFFILYVRTTVSFLLLNLVDLKFHRKYNLNFSWVQMLKWFNSSTNIYFHTTVKSYPLQIGFGLPPNYIIRFFFPPFLRETIIDFELNKIRDEIMLFILKGHDRWKIWLLEIYGCFSSSSSQKGKNVAVEKIWPLEREKIIKTQ